MITALTSIIFTLLLFLSCLQYLKMRRLQAALVTTNRMLNETRELVAAHEKKIKTLIKTLA